jgi:hypothetical protein
VSSAYIPGRIAGEIDVIWAAGTYPPARIDPTRGWRNAAGNVRVHMVDAAHVELITKKLPEFAERVREALAPRAAR